MAITAEKNADTVFITDDNPRSENPNSIVYITGGSEGIGYAIAKQAMIHGAQTIITGRDSSKLLKAKKKLIDISPDIHTQCFDISDDEALYSYNKFLVAEFSPHSIQVPFFLAFFVFDFNK